MSNKITVTKTSQQQMEESRKGLKPATLNQKRMVVPAAEPGPSINTHSLDLSSVTVSRVSDDERRQVADAVTSYLSVPQTTQQYQEDQFIDSVFENMDTPQQQPMTRIEKRPDPSYQAQQQQVHHQQQQQVHHEEPQQQQVQKQVFAPKVVAAAAKKRPRSLAELDYNPFPAPAINHFVGELNWDKQCCERPGVCAPTMGKESKCYGRLIWKCPNCRKFIDWAEEPDVYEGMKLEGNPNYPEDTHSNMIFLQRIEDYNVQVVASKLKRPYIH
jgi:hypothetical protein